MRPVTTIRSHVLTSAAFSANLAARNRATFCAGVSVGRGGGTGAAGGVSWDTLGLRLAALGWTLEEGEDETEVDEKGENVRAAARRIGVGGQWAWGCVAVKRVASAAERRRRVD